MGNIKLTFLPRRDCAELRTHTHTHTNRVQAADVHTHSCPSKAVARMSEENFLQ